MILIHFMQVKDKSLMIYEADAYKPYRLAGG